MNDTLTEVLSQYKDFGPIAILLRHTGGTRAAADDPVTFIDDDRESAATMGRDLAQAFEEAKVALKTVRASRGYPHCVLTAKAIMRAWADAPRVFEDEMLGNPSVFIKDPEKAKQTWNTLGKQQIAEALLCGERVSGWSDDPGADARLLANHVLSLSGAAGNAGLFITHDIVIAATVRWIGGKLIAAENLPRAAVIHRLASDDIGVVLLTISRSSRGLEG